MFWSPAKSVGSPFPASDYPQKNILAIPLYCYVFYTLPSIESAKHGRNTIDFAYTSRYNDYFFVYNIPTFVRLAVIFRANSLRLRFDTVYNVLNITDITYILYVMCSVEVVINGVSKYKRSEFSRNLIANRPKVQYIISGKIIVLSDFFKSIVFSAVLR